MMQILGLRQIEFFSEWKLWLKIGLLMSFISFVEIYLIERKYGVFGGGFGSSITVDSKTELSLFFLAYVLSQLIIAQTILDISKLIARRLSPTCFYYIFCVLIIEFFLMTLTINFQLSSYFSDALSFTVIKNLGGGSIVDALLYVLDELVIGAVALLVIIIINYALWLWVRSNYYVGFTVSYRVNTRKYLVLFILFILSALAITRLATDSYHALTKTIVYSNVSKAINFLTDFDRDHYGVFEKLYDEAPFEPKIYPYSLNEDANGNVYIGGFSSPFLIEDLTPEPIEHTFKHPMSHVVLVVIESTRSDVFGKKIGGKAVAPNLDSLAADGSLIAPNFSHVGFTTNSLKSLFSGELVPKKAAHSLFDDFKGSGYKIGVYSGQAESFGDISSTVNMHANADIFVDAESLKQKRAFSFAAKGSLLLDEKYLLEEFDKNFSDKRDWEKPVFLYFNFQSPHFPYFHDGVELSLIDKAIPRSDINLNNKDAISETYWNAVAYSDKNLGLLISKLKATGVWGNTALFVTSDHGEELYDNGFLGHGHSINFQQNSSFLVSNIRDMLPNGQMALSDFRRVLINYMNGNERLVLDKSPFMYIGELKQPSQIGLSENKGFLTTFNFDSKQVCFVEVKVCKLYSHLENSELVRANALLSRWSSEVIYNRK